MNDKIVSKARQICSYHVHILQTNLINYLKGSNTEGFQLKDIKNKYKYKDVVEWLAISDCMHEKLMQKGEVILENKYGSWWGRTFGQDIALPHDKVMQEIAKEWDR